VVAGDSATTKATVAGDENVLTVTQDDTGQFRTIHEALQNVKPGMTIRVLDDATYTEPLVIDNSARHTGIVLETPKKATIALTREFPRALVHRRRSECAPERVPFPPDGSWRS